MAESSNWLLDFYSPIAALVADLQQKGPAEQVSFALGVVGLVLSIAGIPLALVRQLRTTKQRLEWENENSRQKIDELHRERDRLRKDLDSATARLPETAQVRAAAERRDRNEERAVMLARASSTRTAPSWPAWQLMSPTTTPP